MKTFFNIGAKKIEDIKFDSAHKCAFSKLNESFCEQRGATVLMMK